MISPDHVRLMARYNAWQNKSIYAAAATLDNNARRLDRGAYFGSIHGTLSHLLWGDQMWMHRFAETGLPRADSISNSVDAYATWDELQRDRFAFDDVISNWASGVEAVWLERDLHWTSRAANREFTMPHWLLVTHMFNHQTHHRGQVHAMLTQAGAMPEDTDIPFMPE